MPRKIKGNHYRSASGAEGVAVEVHRRPSAIWPMATGSDPVVILRSENGIHSACKLSKLARATETEKET